MRAIILLVAMCLAQPALACREASDQYSFLWPEEPRDVPEGHEVLRVRVLDFPTYGEHRLGQLEVLDGSRQGDIALARLYLRSNCERPLQMDSTGYVVARFDNEGVISQLAEFHPMREEAIPLANTNGASDD